MCIIRYKFSFLLIVVVLLVKQEVFCKRSNSNGRPRTTARTTPRTYHQQTTQNTYQQANSYQVGNSGPPSAPVLHQQNNPPGIGFDNVNRQSGSSNNHPIGFENVQNRPPQGNQPPPNIGFNNNGYHTPQQQGGGYNPQVPQQTQFGGGYNPHAQQPPGTWNHPTSGYNPQYGGYTPHGGGYNPNTYLSQPGSYYNNFATPGVQPQFYQPQQSSGFGAGSLLGIAGGIGGGYLLGRLTSGGHDQKDNAKENKNEQQFVVHHYYHNGQEFPKQITVSNNSLVTCMENVTKSLCVPNTFPMCLSNGTIMCVTHTRFTVPCSTNTTMACIITALPCNSKDKTCNAASSLSSTVVYVPCISNVTISGQNDTSLGNGDLCITALAEPAKKLESPVPSIINLMSVISTLPFELVQIMNASGITPNATTIATDIKTEMPPTKVLAS